ncbi:hypothetical protein L1987_05972 [Smallanthus sonchifolius]|uniref:Uncharacterized protein n=1 Tax=Smallanthus sonchifolius TaxID=185202 RepID=A0ACB9JWY9_9ASTR|nr:hypothetical protein L1987_05972 [Smallanthus sonchifolius]
MFLSSISATDSFDKSPFRKQCALLISTLSEAHDDLYLLTCQKSFPSSYGASGIPILPQAPSFPFTFELHRSKTFLVSGKWGFNDGSVNWKHMI